MWCQRQRQCGNVLTQSNTEQKQSVQLHCYMHKYTRIHATACYIMRLTSKYELDRHIKATTERL